ncbi:MAG: Ig-like domain-containing protein [Leptolyngbyaceae cyanobacterium bins.302]|nr:Ig-like domain-containing protein [Leptolyngbyaceae cyanobacterium bins.302]
MQRSPTSTQVARFPQPLDRIAIAFIVVLLIIIGVVLVTGSRIAPRVRYFTWQGKQVGADDTAFVIAFSRPMNQASVEKNLKIVPELPGKVSWAGRRMAYTLNTPAPYGTTYKLKLEKAVDYFNQESATQLPIQAFGASFRTRDRAFVYIGVEGEEEGRLVLVNLTTQDRTILTPPDLVVNEFKPYPLGDRILFGATPRSGQSQGLLDQKLYRIATGIQIDPPPQLDPQGNTDPINTAKSQSTQGVELLIDSDTHQNLKFDLSADGKIIVLQRVNRNDPADFGPWILREGEAPKPLKGQPGGDFLITPDSDSLAISQGQGLAILPLYPDAKPVDFLPKFGVVLNFSRDGSLAAMVKFNGDRSRSLFLVSSQGTQKELLRTTGSIFSAQFDPSKQVLYCLLSELIPGETYQEKPFLAAIEIKTGKLTPLLPLPYQRDVQVSLSPDGLAILFDQTTETEQADPLSPQSRGGKAIANSQLWILPINSTDLTTLQPEALPISGLRPRWMP